MQTLLDQIHSAYMECLGSDSELMDGETGICLLQPDTEAVYKNYVSPASWMHISKLVLTGWHIDHFWNSLGLVTPEELLYSLYAMQALPITNSSAMWNHIYPLKPISLSPMPDYIGVWSAAFLNYHNGFTPLLLADTNGLKVIMTRDEVQETGLITYIDFVLMRQLMQDDIESEEDY